MDKLEYQEFGKELVMQLGILAGSDVHIKMDKIFCLNAGEKDSIRMSGRQGLSPGFSLPGLYLQYRNGKEIGEMAWELFRKYSEQDMSADLVMERLDSFENARERIFFRMVNTERNRQMLKKVVHDEYLDLSAVFCILVSEGCENISSVRLTKGLLKKWGTDKDTIREEAMRNTEKLFPLRKESMGTMIRKILVKNLDVPPEQERMLAEMTEGPEAPAVFILSNRQGINGFSSIFYKDCLKKIASDCQTDLFILPSSVHEGLVVPAGPDAKAEELQKIVADVNRECVSVEEFLSDTVYLYDRKENCLKFAERVF